MAHSRYKDWHAYTEAFKLASSIFRMSANFPKVENYSLTDQIRRSSRSVCANLAESYGRRSFPKHFHAKLADCISENFETQVWLDFALDCQYIDAEVHQQYVEASEKVGKILSYMITHSEKFR